MTGCHEVHDGAVWQVWGEYSSGLTKNRRPKMAQLSHGYPRVGSRIFIYTEGVGGSSPSPPTGEPAGNGGVSFATGTTAWAFRADVNTRCQHGTSPRVSLSHDFPRVGLRYRYARNVLGTGQCLGSGGSL
jgi:hypothetical protein